MDLMLAVTLPPESLAICSDQKGNSLFFHMLMKFHVPITLNFFSSICACAGALTSNAQPSDRAISLRNICASLPDLRALTTADIRIGRKAIDAKPNVSEIPWQQPSEWRARNDRKLALGTPSCRC